MKFGDVRRRRDYPHVDLLAGGFPCQPISYLGLKKGEDDERWLWPYFNHIIGQLLPRWVLIENVEGLRANGFQEILEGLALCGYDAEWDRLPASSVGAPHTRFRYFIVAYKPDRSVQAKGKARRAAENSPDAESGGRDQASRVFRKSERRSYALYESGSDGVDAYPNGSPVGQRGPGRALERPSPEISFARFGHWASEPSVGRMAHGVPYRAHRIAGLGNAVVPQVAEWVGRRIMAAEKGTFQ